MFKRKLPKMGEGRGGISSLKPVKVRYDFEQKSMGRHCMLLREMYLDETEAPEAYSELLKSICSIDDDRMCIEMKPIINAITKDEKRHGKLIKEALDGYCPGWSR